MVFSAVPSTCDLIAVSYISRLSQAHGTPPVESCWSDNAPSACPHRGAGHGLNRTVQGNPQGLLALNLCGAHFWRVDGIIIQKRNKSLHRKDFGYYYSICCGGIEKKSLYRRLAGSTEGASGASSPTNSLAGAGLCNHERHPHPHPVIILTWYFSVFLSFTKLPTTPERSIRANIHKPVAQDSGFIRLLCQIYFSHENKNCIRIQSPLRDGTGR